MAWSVIDLSSITDHLIALLKEAFKPTSPVWIENGGTIKRFAPVINGAMPETARDEGGCTLSLYLLHVSQNKFYRNTPVNGPLPQLNRKHPLSLDLYYMLTAYAGDTYAQEQQAMSIALRCFRPSSSSQHSWRTSKCPTTRRCSAPPNSTAPPTIARRSFR